MTSWQLADFVEERELGSGGSGRVVLARHSATGNEVAVKYLAEWLSADAAHLAAFRSEAQLMAGLADPHLVALYEYVETTAGAAIVMDLLEGVALRKILEDGGPLTPEAALTLMKGSLLGLAALHAQGVVHRDYKPENVMVDAGGDTKLVDYGIAAPVGEIAGVSGTPLYMAPEQWRGEPSNAATDVYAATATFVECLTGRPMFTGTTVGALLHQHLTIPPPLNDLPEAVRPLAAAGLAKDPAERIGDATALVAQLDVLAPAAYGPDWETHGRAHLAARAALLALLFAHPERVAHEEAFARTDLGSNASNGSDTAGAAAPGPGPTRAGVRVASADAALRRRRRPLSLVLGALVIAITALALARHAGSNPQSSNAAFEQGQATQPVVAVTPTTTPTPSATPTPTPTPTPTEAPVVTTPPTVPTEAPLTPTPTFTSGPLVTTTPTLAPITSVTVPPTKVAPTKGVPPSSPPPSSPPPGGTLTNKAPPTSPSPSPSPLPPPVINCPPTIAC